MLVLVDLVFAQNDTNPAQDKSFLQKVGETVHKSTPYINAGVNVYNEVAPLFKDDNNFASVNINRGTRHVQFPSCSIQPTTPNIPMYCSFNPMGNQLEQAQTNQRILAFLYKTQLLYESGKATVDNYGNNNNGVACLKQQVKNIDRDFEKISKVLDDSVTQWKLATDALMKEVDTQKEKLTDDYNLLFTGKNDTFNPVKDLLAIPGCEAMFEEDGISATYLGKGEKTEGQAGLMALEKSEAIRVKSANEFNKNASLIEKDLKSTLQQFEQNINNTAMKDLVSDKGIADTLKSKTSDLSQYSLVNTKGFSNALKTSLTAMQTEREGLINTFKEYLKNDDEFLTALREGGDAKNKKGLFTAWQNKQERSCLYREVGASDEASFQKQLYLLAAPKNTKMRQFNCGSQKSCSNYVSTVITTLTNDEEGSSLSQKITRISANKNASVQNVYTFKTPQNPAARLTLGELLRTINNKCKKTMSLNKASYTHVVQKIIAPAIKKLEEQDKNYRNKIVADMRNELMECKGKGVNYGSCQNTLPNAESSFCFRQASLCSTSINTCSKVLQNKIETTREQIKINAQTINSKVKLLKETMHQDLISKMGEMSSVANLQLNIPALSKYAGYESTKNEFTFGTDKNKEDKNAFFSDFEELQKPPLNIKISDPAFASKMYADNIEILRDKYSTMKKKIMAKMEEEISAISANYENALKIIREAIQQCLGANQQLQAYLEKNAQKKQDICLEEEEDKITKMLKEIISNSDTPDKYCDNDKAWEKNKDADSLTGLKKAAHNCKSKADNEVKDLTDACSEYEKLDPDNKNDANNIKVQEVKAKYNALRDRIKNCINQNKEKFTECHNINDEMGSSLKTPKGRDPEKNNSQKDVDGNQ